MDAHRGPGKEELRERYQELLQESRVILPGVQIFFAFLLTAPFSGAFADLDDVERAGWAVAVAAAAIATVVLVTPVAYHHVSDRKARQDRVRMTIRLNQVGLVLTGVAMSAGLFVVARFVLGSVWGVVALVGSAATWAVLWYLLPALRSEEGAMSGS